MENTKQNRLMKAFSSMNRYRTELMGFAAIWIALLHSYAEGPLQGVSIPVISSLMNRGNLGVEIFLILSGIGLYYSMSKDSRALPFYKKRLSRVVMPWLIVSAPYWLIRAHITNHMTVKWLLLNWTGLSFFLDGTTTVWYVVFILVMYLVYPLVFRLQKKKPELVLLLAVLVVMANMLLFLLSSGIYKRYEIALTRIPVFLMGSYLGGILSDRDNKSNQKRLYLVMTYAVAAAVIFLLRGTIRAGHPSLSVMFYRYGGAGIAMLVMLVLCCLFERFNGSRLRSILAFFGTMSLEFYLVNVFVRNLTLSTELIHYGPGVLSCLAAGTAIFGVSVLIGWLFSKGVSAVRRLISSGKELVS
ncbi:MAG: acyltransferase [Oscillospiraceae bacterium]